MGGIQDADERRRAAIAVVDGQVRENGWHRLDLDGMLGALPSPAGAPSASLSGLVGGSVRAAADPASLSRRVPSRAFVSIGRRGNAPVPRFRAARSPVRRVANDNVSPSGETRSVWRDLFFLMVLAATVAGAFWSGRMQGYQKVIVVPGPSSFYSVVT